VGSVGAGSWSARVGSDPFDNVSTAAPSVVSRAIYEARGATLLNLTEYASFWADIEESSGGATINGWAVTRVLTGGSTAQNQVAGGIIQHFTGATANSTEEHFSNDSIINNSKTTAWYMATRFRLPTAADAQSKLGVGLRNGSSTVAIGFFGSVDAVNFRAQYDGNFDTTGISLNVAKDTAFHIFEMWCTGDGVLHARIDGGPSVFTAAMAAVVTAAYRINTARNGATGANRAIDFDWSLYLTGREP
jgi:hypothetical protein